jgi:hypothetical protein
MFSFFVQSVTRPSFELDKIVVHQQQQEIYLPGKVRWSPITIKYYEPMYNAGLANVNQTSSGCPLTGTLSTWFDKIVNGYNYILQRNKKSIDIVGGGYKKHVRVDLLDGEGDSYYYYKLFGAWPIKIEPSELNYTSSELSSVVVTLSYDWAIEWSIKPENPRSTWSIHETVKNKEVEDLIEVEHQRNIANFTAF